MNCEQFPFSANYTEVQLNALKEIWRTKEYRLFPISVFSHIRNDENLQEGAIICWITLFELSYFDKDWCVQISHKELSKYLGNKSERTIYRWLKQLTSFGYLEIYKSRGEIATYAVRFPVEAVLDILQNTPDRKRSSTSLTIKKQFGEIKSQNCEPSVEKDKYKKNVIPNNFLKARENISKVCDKNVSTIMTNLSGGNDKSDIHSLYNNININKNITTRTSTHNSSHAVCDFDKIELQIDSLKERHHKTIERLREINKKFSLPFENAGRLEAMREYNKLDGERHRIEIAIEQNAKKIFY